MLVLMSGSYVVTNLQFGKCFYMENSEYFNSDSIGFLQVAPYLSLILAALSLFSFIKVFKWYNGIGLGAGYFFGFVALLIFLYYLVAAFKFLFGTDTASIIFGIIVILLNLCEIIFNKSKEKE